MCNPTVVMRRCDLYVVNDLLAACSALVSMSFNAGCAEVAYALDTRQRIGVCTNLVLYTMCTDHNNTQNIQMYIRVQALCTVPSMCAAASDIAYPIVVCCLNTLLHLMLVFSITSKRSHQQDPSKTVVSINL